MEWSREKIYTLIALYEEEQCLWNVRSSNYKNIREKHDSLQKIALELGTTSSDVDKKIKSLVSQYRREKRKIEECKKSGSGTDSMYDPKWYGFKLLKFLDDVHDPKETRDTIEEVSQDILTAADELGEPSPVPLDETAAEQSPPPQKRMKRGGGGGRKDHVDKAAVMLQQVMEKQQERRHQNDAVTDFGKFVVSKLKELPPYNRTVATKRIYDVLYEEELKMLRGNHMMPLPVEVTGESSSSSTSYSTPDSPVTFIGTVADISNEQIVFLSDENE